MHQAAEVSVCKEMLIEELILAAALHCMHLYGTVGFLPVLLYT